MPTREQIFEAAVNAMRRGNELINQAADSEHPDYANVMPTLHAAIAAGFTHAEIYTAATQPK